MQQGTVHTSSNKAKLVLESLLRSRPAESHRTRPAAVSSQAARRGTAVLRSVYIVEASAIIVNLVWVILSIVAHNIKGVSLSRWLASHAGQHVRTVALVAMCPVVSRAGGVRKKLA
eukprot:SAG11_NODE_2089_length_3844_cov_3.009880_3_plen_116_part_00